jgi:hypothetical protein
MTRVIVSTIRRNVKTDEPSGFIYIVNLETGKIDQKSKFIEPPNRHLDTNPRGGLRGVRGIALAGDQIAIANASYIYRFDYQWNLLGVTSHPLSMAIHDITFQENTLWVSSARNDLLLQLDYSGRLIRYFYFRAMPLITRILNWNPPVLLSQLDIEQGGLDFRNPLTNDEEVYDRSHVNSVCVLPDGELLVSLGMIVGARFSLLLRLKRWLINNNLWERLLAINRQISATLRMQNLPHTDLIIHPVKGISTVILLDAEGKPSIPLILSNVSVPSHSLHVLSDGSACYLKTTSGEIVHFEISSRKVFSSVKVSEGFLRGICPLSESLFLLGSSGELLYYNLMTCQVEGKITITSEPFEFVYDIKCLPPHYHMPPPDFNGQFQLHST